MKRLNRTLWSLLIVLLIVATASGCGKQTEQANKLVDEVNEIAAAVEPKLDQANNLLLQATDQLSQGKIADEKTSLTKAQGLIDEIAGEIDKAKSKTDEAAALDISDSYRQYLQAKGRALEEARGLSQTTREITVVLLADPAVEKPETLTRVTELENTGTAQSDRLKAAEDEAGRIASEHSDEIEQ